MPLPVQSKPSALLPRLRLQLSHAMPLPVQSKPSAPPSPPAPALQLSYYHRLFDMSSLAHALSREALAAAEERLAPIAPALHKAAATAAKLRDRSGYKWVDMAALYGRLSAAPAPAATQ
jgi:hypothetical protein